jgi:hypothetical protein
MFSRYFLLISSSTRPGGLRLSSLSVGVTMLAALSFAALFATGASAEGTLLADWLWNGAVVTGSLSVETSISLTMEDTKTILGAAAVLCLATVDGSVGANGEAEMTEILNPKGEKIGALGGLALLGTGEGSECKTVKACAEGSAASPIEVTPLGLPWHALLFQHETTGAFLLLLSTSGELGYEVLCLVLGVSSEDKCISAGKDFEIEVANEEEAAAIPGSAQTEPLLNCTQGGEASGKNTEDELTFIRPVGGGKLSVSSEGGGGGGAEPTKLLTTLSGEGKEGETITVLEGSKIKDKATLEGKNASSATGKVVYKVYSDSACKTLYKEAGEVTVTAGSVPASSEEELEGGASYYWQAHYTGDSKNTESTSECNEISSVKAKTSLSTKLSGESKEGEELTVLEGSKVKDKVTITGTKSSTAEGQVTYNVYSDNKCKELVGEAGKESVSSGSAAASEEKELEGGKAYYWQATYKGDSLHQESTSECGKEVLDVKAKTTLTTSLFDEGHSGETIEATSALPVGDKATISGPNSSSSGGTVTYRLYSDSECKTLAAEAGEVSVTGGLAPASFEETMPAGTYYWRASYSGDALHQASSDECGKEIDVVEASTSLETTLSGESHTGNMIEVLEGATISDQATLVGEDSSEAHGTLRYYVYSDAACKELVAEAGEASVSKGSAEPSLAEKLAAGTYYWQATYSGDPSNAASTTTCGEEISVINSTTSLTTTLSGGGHEGTAISVSEGAAVRDRASLTGAHSSEATGSVNYEVYTDSECTDLAAEVDNVTVTAGSIPESTEVTLPPGTYYWRVAYSGDARNHSSVSSCGAETAIVKASTSVATTLSTTGKSGQTLSVLAGAAVKDQATLSGSDIAGATGTVKYQVFSDKECKTLVAEAGEAEVSSGKAGASSSETLSSPGTYYWRASYSGDSHNEASSSTCGSEITIVRSTLLTTSLTGEGHSGEHIKVVEGAVHDTATLGGENASIATGKVKYKVYSDKECKTLVTEAGEVTVTAGTVPNSEEKTLSAGTYYWQASYSGDEHNEASTAPCGEEIVVVGPTAPQVERVDFTNNLPVLIDHQTDTWPERAEGIEEFTGHDDAEWEYAPSTGEMIKSWPVAYASEQTPKLRARFELPAETKQLITEKRLTGKPVISGEATVDSEAIAFTKEFSSAKALEEDVLRHEGYIEVGEVTYESPISASKALPDTAGYEPLTIDWTWTVELTGTPGSITQSLGSSESNLYVTIAEPPAPPCATVAEAESASSETFSEEGEGVGACVPIYFTTLQQGLGGRRLFRGPLREFELIAMVWKIFSKEEKMTMLPAGPLRAVNRDPIPVPYVTPELYDPRTGMWRQIPAGQTYRYYQPVTPGRNATVDVNPRLGCDTWEATLADGTGKCGAWAEGLWLSLNADGARSARRVHLSVNLGAAAPKCRPTEPFVCVMLVKNWHFPPGVMGPGFPFLANTVTDTLGIAGQGNENPPPYFWDHEIVKAGTGAEKSSALYDPSYGTGPFPAAAELAEIIAGTRPQPSEDEVLRQYSEASTQGYCEPPGNVWLTLPVRCQEGWVRLRPVAGFAQIALPWP